MLDLLDSLDWCPCNFRKPPGTQVLYEVSVRKVVFKVRTKTSPPDVELERWVWNWKCRAPVAAAGKSRGQLESVGDTICLDIPFRGIIDNAVLYKQKLGSYLPQ